MTTTYPEYGKSAPQSYPLATYSSSTTYDSNHPMDLTKDMSIGRGINRTPSPTPSEEAELKSGALNWKMLMNWRFWVRKDWLWYYVGFILILTITALVTIYHKQIVHWLTPVANWLHDIQFGWLVPVAVLFVISFPPLFGHEIVAVLCGLVWGLWIGFGIVAAGTFIGEVGNFYAFKYCCRARGEKLERTKIFYGALARVVREGGFKIALIARLSAIPGHFTTAVFSTCGMSIFVFSIAAILSMPKQFITVYLGVILEQSDTGTADPKSRIISDVVLAVTFLITGLAMWYMLHEIAKVKPAVIYERRKARQAKIARGGTMPYGVASNSATDSTISVFNPRASESEIPLTAQQWDKEGRATGFSIQPPLHSPQPKRALSTRSIEAAGRYAPDPRDEEEAYGPGMLPSHHGREDSGDLVGWDMTDAPLNKNPYQQPRQYSPPQQQFNPQQQFSSQQQFNPQRQLSPQQQYNSQQQSNPQQQYNTQQQFNPQRQSISQTQNNPQRQFSSQQQQQQHNSQPQFNPQQQPNNQKQSSVQHTRSPPLGQNTISPPPQLVPRYRAPSPTDRPTYTAHQTTSPDPSLEVEPETPTQAKTTQYASYLNSNQARISRLPTPPYPSPFDDGNAGRGGDRSDNDRSRTSSPQYRHYGHGLEATDSSYTTAHSRGGTEAEGISPSPSPPSIISHSELR